MTPFDITCAVIVAGFAVWGALRGLLRQIFGIAGLVGGIVLARLFSQPFGDAFARDLHVPNGVAVAGMSMLLYFLCTIIAKQVGKSLHDKMHGGFSGGVEAGGGFFVGMAKGLLVAWAVASLVALLRPHFRNVERDTPVARLELGESRAIRFSQDTNLVTELRKPDRADEIRERLRSRYVRSAAASSSPSRPTA